MYEIKCNIFVYLSVGNEINMNMKYEMCVDNDIYEHDIYYFFKFFFKDDLSNSFLRFFVKLCL